MKRTDLKNPRIWLVDDDEIFRYTARRVLEQNGLLNVTGFEMAEKAIEAIELGEKPDILLLDINMPTMDGWEFLRAFEEMDQNLTSNVKVFVLSSSVYEPDRIRAASHDCVLRYLTKPLSSQSLNELFEQ